MRRNALIMLMATLAFGAPAAGAAGDGTQPGVFVRQVATELRDEVYYLDARIDYRFSAEALEALHRGVPLTVGLQIEILRIRGYLWDEKIAALEQRYRLSYHALTRQYVIRNLNSGSRYSLPTLEAAVSILGTVVDLPLLDSNLLEPGERYMGRLRAELVADELPVPLRLLALISPEWHLGSEWYTWRL